MNVDKRVLFLHHEWVSKNVYCGLVSHYEKKMKLIIGHKEHTTNGWSYLFKYQMCLLGVTVIP